MEDGRSSMNHAAAIHVAGADTMIGAAVLRALARNGYHNVVSSLLDCPDYVFVAAGQSGGILANQKYPADLCLDNAAMIAGLGYHTYQRTGLDERFPLEPQTRIVF